MTIEQLKALQEFVKAGTPLPVGTFDFFEDELDKILKSKHRDRCLELANNLESIKDRFYVLPDYYQTKIKDVIKSAAETKDSKIFDYVNSLISIISQKPNLSGKDTFFELMTAINEIFKSNTLDEAHVACTLLETWLPYDESKKAAFKDACKVVSRIVKVQEGTYKYKIFEDIKSRYNNYGTGEKYPSYIGALLSCNDFAEYNKVYDYMQRSQTNIQDSNIVFYLSDIPNSKEDQRFEEQHRKYIKFLDECIKDYEDLVHLLKECGLKEQVLEFNKAIKCITSFNEEDAQMCEDIIRQVLKAKSLGELETSKTVDYIRMLRESLTFITGHTDPANSGLIYLAMHISSANIKDYIAIDNSEVKNTNFRLLHTALKAANPTSAQKVRCFRILIKYILNSTSLKTDKVSILGIINQLSDEAIEPDNIRTSLEYEILEENSKTAINYLLDKTKYELNEDEENRIAVELEYIFNGNIEAVELVQKQEEKDPVKTSIEETSLNLFLANFLNDKRISAEKITEFQILLASAQGTLQQKVAIKFIMKFYKKLLWNPTAKLFKNILNRILQSETNKEGALLIELTPEEEIEIWNTGAEFSFYEESADEEISDELKKIELYKYFDGEIPMSVQPIFATGDPEAQNMVLEAMEKQPNSLENPHIATVRMNGASLARVLKRNNNKKEAKADE